MFCVELPLDSRNLQKNSPVAARRRLAASIELDRQAMRSETLGYNADPSEFASLTGFTDARLSRYLHDNRVTVNGVQY